MTRLPSVPMCFQVVVSEFLQGLALGLWSRGFLLPRDGATVLIVAWFSAVALNPSKQSFGDGGLPQPFVMVPYNILQCSSDGSTEGA